MGLRRKVMGITEKLCIPSKCVAHQIRSEKKDVETGTYLFIFFRIFRMVVLTPVE